MSFDRRITPVRADLADERLRGQVDAERYTTGTVKRVITTFSPLHRHPSREAPVDTQAIFGESVTVYDEHEGWAWVAICRALPSVSLSRSPPTGSGRSAPSSIRVRT
jgi:hypothetical protein